MSDKQSTPFWDWVIIKRSKIIIFLTIATMLGSCSAVSKVFKSGLGNRVVEIVGLFALNKAADKLTQNTENQHQKEKTTQNTENQHQKEIPTQNTENQISKQEYLLQLANEMNKSVPSMTDRDTQLYNVTAEENALTFNYTLVNYASWQVDPNTFHKNMESLRDTVCSAYLPKILLPKNISLYYSYHGNDHRFIAGITVTPSDCGY